MGILSPLSKQSFQNMQLNAGLFLKDFDYSSYKDADALRKGVKSAIASRTGLIGATRGGGTFVFTPEIRYIDADGKRGEFIGSTVMDGGEAKLTGTMLEVTAQNMADTLVTANKTTDGNVTTITVSTTITEEHYISSLCWIGEKIDGTLILIDLKNALNTNGLTLTFTDKGEGTIPFEFVAHQDDVNEQDELPFKIIEFGKAA